MLEFLGIFILEQAKFQESVRKQTINNYLENVRLKILQINNDLLAAKKEITGEVLKNYFLVIDESKMTIIAVFKEI